MSDALNSRAAVEDFLFHEADLLDSWRLPEWSDLYTEDAHYDIASLDAPDPLAADPGTSLFVLSDPKFRIVSRAKRLMKKTAHAEYPHSKTRHLLTNIKLGDGDAMERKVRANFVVYRTKGEKTVQYMGEAHYVLKLVDGKIMIHRKRCVLDLNTLADQGRLTIIL